MSQAKYGAHMTLCHVFTVSHANAMQCHFFQKEHAGCRSTLDLRYEQSGSAASQLTNAKQCKLDKADQTSHHRSTLSRAGMQTQQTPKRPPVSHKQVLEHVNRGQAVPLPTKNKQQGKLTAVTDMWPMLKHRCAVALSGARRLGCSNVRHSTVLVGLEAQSCDRQHQGSFVGLRVNVIAVLNSAL